MDRELEGGEIVEGWAGWRMAWIPSLTVVPPLEMFLHVEEHEWDQPYQRFLLSAERGVWGIDIW